MYVCMHVLLKIGGGVQDVWRTLWGSGDVWQSV